MMNTFMRLLCLFLSCTGKMEYLETGNTLDGLLDDSTCKLKSILVLHVLSYLDDPLILRSLNHENNNKMIKLYKRFVSEEFGDSLSGMTVFSSWSLGCVKFVHQMLPYIDEINNNRRNEGKIIKKLKPAGNLNKRRKGSRITPCNSEPDVHEFKKLNLIEIIDHFIEIFNIQGKSKPLEILLDFLNYSNVNLSSEMAPKLYSLLLEIREVDNKHLPLAYKIILLFGHDSFSQAGRSENSNEKKIWLACDTRRMKDLTYQMMRLSMDSSERSNWDSIFQDPDELCRGTGFILKHNELDIKSGQSVLKESGYNFSRSNSKFHVKIYKRTLEAVYLSYAKEGGGKQNVMFREYLVKWIIYLMDIINRVKCNKIEPK